MTEPLESAVQEICCRFGDDRGRMMDIVREVQQRFGCVSSQAMDLIARQLQADRIDVESVVSFYAFLSEKPKGKVVIRLCNDIIDRFAGADRVAQVLEDELGISFGQTTPDGQITLEYTPCIGMCDQAPAALVNDEVINWLSPDTARRVVRELRQHMDPRKLVHKLGDGNNAHELIRSRVVNNLCQPGPVVFADLTPGDAIRKAVAMTPAEVIRDVKTARLRGRGGAGFPAGMKWDFTRAAVGDTKYVLCNADEGEPGTFKDRVILTERPDTVFEGMTVAGYAIGAKHGLFYLRAEYAYLRQFLEHTLNERRRSGLLGKDVAGKKGFDFDIRIQMGAGAYICGEESSLISSCEGLRGDPKTRPPFPAQKGYNGCPTAVNNVETFCCAARVLEKGPGWFAQMGSKGSPGTKVISVSGDVMRPGVYEVSFGTRLGDFLRMCGGEDAAAVQVGGPSGQMVGPKDFGRTICYDDLATGGSLMVFGPQRDLLQVVDAFLDFFIEESCGYCTACRVGNVLLKERLERIRRGKGEPEDIAYLRDLGQTMKITARCGLGQTSPNPIVSTLDHFPELYQTLLKVQPEGFQASFDIHAMLCDAEAIAGRPSVLYTE